MDRRERIRRFITPQQKGIEIGPYYQPIAPKRLGYNCLVLDVFDGAALRARALDEPNIPDDSINNIEEVDFIGSSGAIAALVAGRHQLGTFDYIISSHNFEHLPDPIRFLQGCAKVLRLGGVLSMAIPDRRTCFDYFRPNSTLAEMIEAFFAERERPTLAQLFEQNSLHSRYGEKLMGGFKLADDPSEIVPLENLAEAFEEWCELRARPDNEYRDAHCWTFTPASFELILRDLDFLQLTCWEVLEVSESSGTEFFVHLRSVAPGVRKRGFGRDFYDRRYHLLRRANNEVAANSLRDLDQQRHIKEMADEIKQIKSSISWRITAPLRMISRAVWPAPRPAEPRPAQRLAGPRPTRPDLSPIKAR